MIKPKNIFLVVLVFINLIKEQNASFVIEECPGILQNGKCWSTDLSCPQFKMSTCESGTCDVCSVAEAAQFCQQNQDGTSFYYCYDANCNDIEGFMNSTQGNSSFVCESESCPGSVQSDLVGYNSAVWFCSGQGGAIMCPTYYVYAGTWDCVTSGCPGGMVLDGDEYICRDTLTESTYGEQYFIFAALFGVFVIISILLLFFYVRLRRKYAKSIQQNQSFVNSNA